MTEQCAGSAERLLVALSLRRNAAKVLIHIAFNGEMTSDDLEEALGIGQPSVSAAIKDLCGMGWLTIEHMRSDTKGRPRHTYKLSKGFSEIADEIEGIAKIRIWEINEGLRYLRSV